MFEEAAEIIETRLYSNWTATPIDYDNVEYNPARGTAFVRLQIEWVDTIMTSITGRTKGSGYIDLSLFVPSNTGIRTVNGLADDLAALFNRYNSGGVRFESARTQRIGKQEQWYQLKVLVPFTYDQCYALPA